MELQTPPPELLPYGLRAMKTVAMADGAFSPQERDLLANAQAVFGGSIDVDALPPIEPAELAEHVKTPELRRQLVRGMIVLSLVDGEASPAEAAVVGRFADALGVARQDVDTLRRLADGHLVAARFDIARRFWARDKAIEVARERGLGWVVKAVAAMTGLHEDKAVSARYRSLADAPAGSLGRGYFDFIQKNGFSFPGEKGHPPEFIALHDLTHVLAGYDTSGSGELQVLAFHAGCRREDKDPFGFLLFGIAEFHLGLAISPIVNQERGHLDPATFLRALRRGVACRIDPTDGWDPWPVMHEQLDVLRDRYGIPLA